MATYAPWGWDALEQSVDYNVKIGATFEKFITVFDQTKTQRSLTGLQVTGTVKKFVGDSRAIDFTVTKVDEDSGFFKINLHYYDTMTLLPGAKYRYVTYADDGTDRWVLQQGDLIAEA